MAEDEPAELTKSLPRLNLVVGVSGASGAVYAERFILALTRLMRGESSLIISPAAIRIRREERNSKVTTPAEYLEEILSSISPEQRGQSFVPEDHRDVGARPASGSAPYDGMVIVPCSMKTLAALAHGYTTNLLERAGDVALKERRKLIVVPRETPYNLVHLRNMTALTEAGGIVLPASPGFYQKPETLEDLGDFIGGRILAIFGVAHSLYSSWEG